MARKKGKDTFWSFFGNKETMEDREEQDSRRDGQGAVSWTGVSITSLTMWRKASLLYRLDVLPFVGLYAFVIAMKFAYNLSLFSFLFFSGFSVFLHILSFLSQHWSVSVRMIVSWSRVHQIDSSNLGKNLGIYVKLVPQPHRGKADLVPLSIDHGRLNFRFHNRMYEYNPEKNIFERVEYPVDLPLSHYTKAARSPSIIINESTAGELTHRFGRNVLELPCPKFLDLYLESLLSPFFIFQLFCMVLWMLDEYWRYALMTLGMMLLFEGIVVKNRLRSLAELRGMRNAPRNLFVYRNKEWVKVSSANLFPGDIMSVSRSADPAHVVPCDCLLLAGGVVVNEAMLTGESVPLIKEPIWPLEPEQEKTLLSLKATHKPHVLFAGTRVLTHTSASPNSATPSSRPPDGGAIVYVLRTSFASAQGELLTTLMYSTQTLSANSLEALLFVLFLLVFAIAAASYVLYHTFGDPTRSRYEILMHCVLIITSVVPPELPMQLSLAVNTSLISLARNYVFCTEPFRIPYAGKVDVACFDKTGTITTDDIVAAGVHLPSEIRGGDQKTEEEGAIDSIYLQTSLEDSFDAAAVLAGCNSLVMVDRELVGDPLEVAALNFAKWTHSGQDTVTAGRSSAHPGSALRIITRHRFLSSLQRMSVVATISQAGKGEAVPAVLVKGSAEAIGRLLRNVPAEYDATAKSLARKGFRVLALAGRKLDSNYRVSELPKIPREEVESSLDFYGLICFECPLRRDSRKAIRVLRKSGTQVCMITGDATLTAVHVAKMVGIVNKPTLILERDQSTHGQDGKPLEVLWVSAASGKRKKRWTVSKMRDLSDEWELCVSGPALEWILRNMGTTSAEFWGQLQYVKIFARMTPIQKERILVSFKSIGLYTLMCGDGTNDVGALKQAHVGVALLSTTPAVGGAQEGSQQKKELTKLQDRTSSKPTTTRKRKRITKVRRDGSMKSAREGSEPKQLTKEELLARKVEELNSSLADSSDEPPLVKLGDASIASPFTSKRMTIESCVSIVRQGRCTLATTMQMYQILALNCLIQAYSLSVLRLDGVKIGDTQMTIDAFVIAIAFFLIARSKPLKKLSPERPATSIFAPALFVSLLGQFVIHVGALIWITSIAKGFLPDDFKAVVDGEFAPNVLNSVVYLLSTAQQVSVFLVNYKGRPHMEGLFDNRALLNMLCVSGSIVVLCTLGVSEQLNDFMQLAPWPNTELKMQVVTAVLVDLFGCVVWDQLMVKLFSPKPRQVK